MSFKLDCSDIFKGLGNFEMKVKVGTRKYAEVSGEKMVNYAKSNANWHDSTVKSRQTIDSTVNSHGNNQKITIAGHTPHFKWLELAHENKYAILNPTIKKLGPEIVRGWVSIIK